MASTLLLCASVLTVGCSGGGGSSSGSGSDNGGGSGTVSTATTTVSGTTGSASSAGATSSSLFSTQLSAVPTPSNDTTALLRVDKNGDGILDESDYIYSIPVLSDGSFSFDAVTVDEKNATKAQLTVKKEGYAPIVKTVTLRKDTPFSIFADIGTKPLLTEVVKLPTTASDRANSFLKFGVTSNEGGVASFSKLMTLSELKAEAAVGLGAGTLTTASIPVSAFGSGVKSVTVKMQTFDSTKKDDIGHFPGAFSGHGKPAIGSSATSDTTENALESAAFDLLELTDQNGNAIDLNMTSQSKLSTQADASTCSGMYWVRHVTSSQAAVIQAWGDDDNDSSNGFQVPIWSNDNATGSWAYVGLGDWDSANSQFSACVDTKWQGYLNCDSEINVGVAPKELCVYAQDQFGENAEGISFTAQKGNTYTSSYIYDGKATIDLATGTPANWNISYSGAMTSWQHVGVDSSDAVASTTPGCDYELNVTVDNPYSAQIYVFAYDANKTVANAYVTLTNYTYRDYYSESAYTNSKGYAIFKVKPNVVYTAGYKAGTSAVNVNGSIVAPETADSGKYASVDVKDQNVAPTAYIYMRDFINDNAETLAFTVSASDKNGDAVTLKSLKMGATSLVEGSDYTLTYTSSYAGSLYVNGILDLNSTTLAGITPTSLSKGNYTFNAVVSDGKLDTTASSNITVGGNTAPVINSLYLVDSSYNYYYPGDAIPVGDYGLSFYVYDRDGYVARTSMKIDDVGYTSGTSTTLTSGEHNVSIVASDGTLESSKDVTIFVGNHAPEIKSAGATSYLVDINSADKTFKLFAYVTDAENSPLTVVATSDANATYPLTRVTSYGSKYESADIALTSAAENIFSIVASDGEDNSTASVVKVTTIAANQAPIFTKQPTDAQVNVNDAQVFECEATDPEGTLVSYTWALNGTAQSETGTTFTKTFTTTGSNRLSCTATDADGKSSVSTAQILVVDSSVSKTLTVHAKYEGLIVSIHNSSTYKVESKTFTDTKGDATFNVTGDRVTFGVTAWPGMEIKKALLMDLLKIGDIQEAYYSCDNNTSKECTTADWCAMTQADTIKDWVWDANVDESGTKPAASLVDTNSDGSISQDELYTGALAVLDANKDGKLTYDEIPLNSSISRMTTMQIFANVPAQEYYIYLDQLNDQQYNEGPSFDSKECYYDSETIKSWLSVDYSSTAIDAASKSFSVSGSGYASVYNQTPDKNNTIAMNLYTYNADENGKYAYLLREQDSNGSVPRFYLLTDLTKQQVEANITVNAAKFATPDKSVSFVNGENSSLDLNTLYKGLYMSNHVGIDDGDGNNLTHTESFYTHTGFIYNIATYGSQDAKHNSKSTINYYGDGKLKDSYNVADYPFLDVAFTVNENDWSWTFAGSDMNKVNVVDFDYQASSSGYDGNGNSYNNSLDITIDWTVAPSQAPSFKLKDVIPSEAFADANATVSANNVYEVVDLSAMEFKDQTETSLLNFVSGSSSTSGSINTLLNGGIRQVSYESYNQGGVYSTFSAENKKAKRDTSLFSINLNPRHVPSN